MKILLSASLTPPLFIEMLVPSQESEQRCIHQCINFPIRFGIVPTAIFFLFISLLSYKGRRGRDLEYA
jgi:hypothetical protein